MRPPVSPSSGPLPPAGRPSRGSCPARPCNPRPAGTPWRPRSGPRPPPYPRRSGNGIAASAAGCPCNPESGSARGSHPHRPCFPALPRPGGRYIPWPAPQPRDNPPAIRRRPAPRRSPRLPAAHWPYQTGSPAPGICAPRSPGPQLPLRPGRRPGRPSRTAGSPASGRLCPPARRSLPAPRFPAAAGLQRPVHQSLRMFPPRRQPAATRIRQSSLPFPGRTPHPAASPGRRCNFPVPFPGQPAVCAVPGSHPGPVRLSAPGTVPGNSPAGSAVRAGRGPGCIPLPGCAAAARCLPVRSGRTGPAAFPAGTPAFPLPRGRNARIPLPCPAGSGRRRSPGPGSAVRRRRPTVRPAVPGIPRRNRRRHISAASAPGRKAARSGCIPFRFRPSAARYRYPQTRSFQRLLPRCARRRKSPWARSLQTWNGAARSGRGPGIPFFPFPARWRSAAAR